MHKSLYDFVQPSAARLGLPIVFAYQNAPRIQKPYMSLRVDTLRKAQHHIYLPVDDRGYQDTVSWYIATIEAQTFGEDAGSKARQLSMLLATERSLERAQRLNVAVGNHLFVSEIPELLNMSQWEERGIFQFEFMFTEVVNDEVGLIENVEIKGASCFPSDWDGGRSVWDDTDSIWDLCKLCDIYIGITTEWDDGETEWDDGDTVWGT